MKLSLVKQISKLYFKSSPYCCFASFMSHHILHVGCHRRINLRQFKLESSLMATLFFDICLVCLYAPWFTLHLILIALEIMTWHDESFMSLESQICYYCMYIAGELSCTLDLLVCLVELGLFHPLLNLFFCFFFHFLLTDRFNVFCLLYGIVGV